MFFIPGQVISAVTFPGVIVHEAAHLFFCRMRRVAVFDACFFRFGNPAGYVIHEETDSFLTTLLICLGPLLINSLLCILICASAFFPHQVFQRSDIFTYLLLWLGISIGMHSFPSTGDANTLWHNGVQALKRFNLLALVAFPLVVLIYLANVLRILWFDAIYAFAIGLGLPTLLFESMA